MTRKIGILTYAYDNYGGCLQAYALQAYLKKQPGLQVANINFKTLEQEKKQRIFHTSDPNLLVRAATLLLLLYRYPGLRRRKERMREFKQQYLSFTPLCRDYEEVRRQSLAFDVLVSGSDQVFNPVYPTRRIFYLDLGKAPYRKVAYAPSFGISEFPPRMVEMIAPWVQDFDALSCREQEGAELLKKITDRKVPVLADPTLLLDRKEWERIAVKPRNEGSYIFVYDLNGGSDLVAMAQEIKRRTGLRIICQTQKVRKFYPVDRQIYDSGPAEFLGWIRHAEYVITDSFHGTLFSVLFDRRFYTYIAYPRTSSRVRNLLSLLRLSDRIVENGAYRSFRSDDTLQHADMERLNPLIERSKAFIEKNIATRSLT